MDGELGPGVCPSPQHVVRQECIEPWSRPTEVKVTLEEFDTLVSEISERAYFSGWQSHIELDLWLIALGAIPPKLGGTEVTDAELQLMQEHVANHATWTSWERGAGPRLVPLLDWFVLARRIHRSRPWSLAPMLDD